MKNGWLVYIAANPLLLLTFCLSSHLPPRCCKKLSHGAQLLWCKGRQHSTGVPTSWIWLLLWFQQEKKKQTFYHVHLSLLLKALSLKMLPLYSTHNTRFSKVGPVRCRMPFFSYWERADPPVVTPLGFPPSMGGKESFRLQEALEELKPQAQC